MKLPDNLITDFSDALLDAYRNIDDFDSMLYYKFKKLNREDISASGTRPTIFRKVIDEFESRDKTTDLLIAARQSKPDNVRLLKVAIEAGVDIELSKQSMNDSSIKPVVNTRELERVVREGIPHISIELFYERLGLIRGRVCRIEYLNSNGKQIYGTGFLIGPDCLLTNYHVMEEVIENKVLPENVKFRFDYKELTDGQILSGNIFGLAKQNWLIDYSKYSETDKTDILSSLPKNDELDYALLLLDEEVGNNPIGNSSNQNTTKRGWIDLCGVDYPFETDSGIIIAQHPEGNPLKLTIDTQAVILVNENKTRVRYRTNTEKGSSGSPCFNMNLDLVALHHSGDPNFEKFHQPTYNQGIPTSMINRLLEERKKKSL